MSRNMRSVLFLIGLSLVASVVMLALSGLFAAVLADTPNAIEYREYTGDVYVADLDRFGVKCVMAPEVEAIECLPDAFWLFGRRPPSSTGDVIPYQGDVAYFYHRDRRVICLVLWPDGTEMADCGPAGYASFKQE